MSVFAAFQRLARGSFVFGLGDTLPRLASFILLPLYTLYLSPADYGRLSMAGQFGLFFRAFFFLGLEGAFFRFYFDYRKDPEKLRAMQRSVVSVLLVFNLFVAAPFFFFGEGLVRWIVKDPGFTFHPYVSLVILTNYCYLLPEIALIRYQATNRAAKYAAYRLLSFALMTAGIVYFVVVREEGAAGNLRGHFLASLVLFLAYAAPMVRESGLGFDWPTIRPLLAYGLPLVPRALLAWVFTTLDKVILERFHTMEDLGLYDLGLKMAMGLEILLMAVNTAWQPQFLEAMTDEDGGRGAGRTELGRLATFVLAGVTLAGGALLLSSKYLFLLLTSRPEFHAAYLVCNIFVLGYVARAVWILTNGVFAYQKRSYVYLYVLVICALANLDLNLLWIPSYGMIGAAMSTALIGYFRIPLLFFAVRGDFMARFEWGRISLLLLLLALLYRASQEVELALPLAWEIPAKIGLWFALALSIFLLRILRWDQVKGFTSRWRGENK